MLFRTNNILCVGLGLFAVAALTSCSHRKPVSVGTAVPISPGSAVTEEPIVGDPTVQTRLADKSTLSAISKDDIRAVNALDANDRTGVLANSGTVQAVKGTLCRIYYPHAGSFLMLNFNTHYTRAAAAHVPASLFSKLPDLRPYIGKSLWISGSIINYEGHPEVNVGSPSDIKIIK